MTWLEVSEFKRKPCWGNLPPPVAGIKVIGGRSISVVIGVQKTKNSQSFSRIFSASNVKRFFQSQILKIKETWLSSFTTCYYAISSGIWGLILILFTTTVSATHLRWLRMTLLTTQTNRPKFETYVSFPVETSKRCAFSCQLVPPWQSFSSKDAMFVLLKFRNLYEVLLRRDQDDSKTYLLSYAFLPLRMIGHIDKNPAHRIHRGIGSSVNQIAKEHFEFIWLVVLSNHFLIRVDETVDVISGTLLNVLVKQFK
jgi:hypothetical protein